MIKINTHQLLSKVSIISLTIMIGITWFYFDHVAVYTLSLINIENPIFEYKSSLGSKSPYINRCPDCHVLPNCKLNQVQMLSRHGARYWSSSKHAHFFDLVDYITGNVPDNHRLKNFSIPYPRDGAALLTPIGKRNMQLAGQNFQKKYKDTNLLRNNSKITVYSSETERVIHSAESFLSGCFENHSLPIKIADKQQDADLNPIHSCQKYKDLNYDLDAQKQVELWEIKFLDEATQRFSKELGIPLTNRQAILLMELCASMISLLEYTRFQGVCYLLNDLDFKNYEIKDDLEKYYLLGYAFDFNQKLACSLVTSIYTDVKNSSLNLALRFAHAETVLPLLVSLGMFHDLELTATMPEDELEKREFITGKFLTFGSNVVFEFYTCGTTESIRVLLNERAVNIPGCAGKDGICSKDNFLKVLDRAGNGCDFNSICENDSSNNQ